MSLFFVAVLADLQRVVCLTFFYNVKVFSMALRLSDLSAMSGFQSMDVGIHMV